MVLCDFRGDLTAPPRNTQGQRRKAATVIGKEKERADSSSTQHSRMKEVEVQDSKQATSSRIKNLCACFHMLWFTGVGIRKQAKTFLAEPRAPHLTNNSL